RADGPPRGTDTLLGSRRCVPRRARCSRDRAHLGGERVAAEMIDHEFGSQDTELKLSIVEAYLRQFTTALTGKFSELWYIDAFAGTGDRAVRVAARGGDLFDEPAPERIDRRRGSARIAIEITPQFDRLVFMERKKRYCEALRQLSAKHPERQID